MKKAKAKPKKSAPKKEKESSQEIAEKPVKNNKKYYEAVGRLKTAIARVRLFTSNISQSAVD